MVLVDRVDRLLLPFPHYLVHHLFRVYHRHPVVQEDPLDLVFRARRVFQLAQLVLEVQEDHLLLAVQVVLVHPERPLLLLDMLSLQRAQDL